MSHRALLIRGGGVEGGMKAFHFIQNGNIYRIIIKMARGVKEPVVGEIKPGGLISKALEAVQLRVKERCKRRCLQPYSNQTRAKKLKSSINANLWKNSHQT